MKKQTPKPERLEDFRPAALNANKHTERGIRMLNDAMAEDGFVAPMTAAADGEILDGSARLETAAERFPDIQPIVVEHDGRRPIIMVRKDIPNAQTPQAKRIALRSNKIAEADLSWDTEVLMEMKGEGLLEGLWTDEEISKLLEQAGTELLNEEQSEGGKTVTCPACGHEFSPKRGGP